MHQMDMPMDYYVGPYEVQCWNAIRDYLTDIAELKTASLTI